MNVYPFYWINAPRSATEAYMLSFTTGWGLAYAGKHAGASVRLVRDTE